MPTMNNGSRAPQSRAVAAAIPEDPVTRRTSLTSPLFSEGLYSKRCLRLFR
jgi:hypothetical protein